jgi:ABC-type uncharacterized transport system permease subunit
MTITKIIQCLQEECPLGKLLNPSIIICVVISVVQTAILDNPKVGSALPAAGLQRDNISGLGLPAVIYIFFC